MASNRSKGSLNKSELEDFRALQEEMLNLSREYSRDRLAVWAEETRSLSETWSAFAREWQGSLEEMSGLAMNQFEAIAAQGEASSNLFAQSWGKTLTGLSGQVDEWGEHFLQVLGRVAEAWAGTLGGWAGGAGPSFWGSLLEIGGWFHQGGIVEAHQGMVISPGTLLGEEQLVLAQSGEGILPRESMARIGEKNFEALRSGRFDLAPGGAAPRYDITIQVQSLDAAGVAGLNWDRLVQRHLLPALQREVGQRW